MNYDDLVHQRVGVAAAAAAAADASALLLLWSLERRRRVGELRVAPELDGVNLVLDLTAEGLCLLRARQSGGGNMGCLAAALWSAA